MKQASFNWESTTVILAFFIPTTLVILLYKLEIAINYLPWQKVTIYQVLKHCFILKNVNRNFNLNQYSDNDLLPTKLCAETSNLISQRHNEWWPGENLLTRQLASRAGAIWSISQEHTTCLVQICFRQQGLHGRYRLQSC